MADPTAAYLLAPPGQPYEQGGLSFSAFASVPCKLGLQFRGTDGARALLFTSPLFGLGQWGALGRF